MSDDKSGILTSRGPTPTRRRERVVPRGAVAILVLAASCRGTRSDIEVHGAATTPPSRSEVTNATADAPAYQPVGKVIPAEGRCFCPISASLKLEEEAPRLHSSSLISNRIPRPRLESTFSTGCYASIASTPTRPGIRPPAYRVPTERLSCGADQPPEALAPFVPTPSKIVHAMLSLAQVRPEDTVYDLGSGDGRVLFMAERDFGAAAVGVEIDAALAESCTEQIRRLGLSARIRVIHGDLLETDLTPASVVTVYLSPLASRKLEPRLESMLRPGARVVAHDYPFPAWVEVDRRRLWDDRGHEHTIYLYQR